MYTPDHYSLLFPYCIICGKVKLIHLFVITYHFEFYAIERAVMVIYGAHRDTESLFYLYRLFTQPLIKASFGAFISSHNTGHSSYWLTGMTIPVGSAFRGAHLPLTTAHRAAIVRWREESRECGAMCLVEAAARQSVLELHAASDTGQTQTARRHTCRGSTPCPVSWGGGSHLTPLRRVRGRRRAAPHFLTPLPWVTHSFRVQAVGLEFLWLQGSRSANKSPML